MWKIKTKVVLSLILKIKLGTNIKVYVPLMIKNQTINAYFSAAIKTHI